MQWTLSKTKARRTLDAKRANDIAPKKYKIGTKIGRVLFSRGGAWKMCICTLNRQKCTELVLFLSHTQIDKKNNR